MGEIHFLSVKDVLFCSLTLFMIAEPVFTHGDCKEDSCFPPRSKKDGSYNITESKKYRHGDKISYQCLYHGSYMFGSSSLTCEEDGSWFGEEPYCAYSETILDVKHDSTKNKELFDRREVTCIQSGTEEPWNIKTLENISGYIIIEVIVQVLERHHSDNFMKQARVVIENCEVAAIEEAFRQGNNQYLKYTFKCNVKDELCNFKIIPTLQWYQINLCEIHIYRKPRNICPSNIKICNGGINYTSSDVDGINDSRVFIYCNEGYKLEGKRVLHCKDGTFLGIDETKCTRISCNSTPPMVVNGKWFHWSSSKIYYYGDRLIVICDSGHTLNSGINFTQCQDDGSWSVAYAVCSREETISGVLVPIAISMIVLTVLVIAIVLAYLCCCRRKSEKTKDKTAESIYSEPSYCTSEFSAKSFNSLTSRPLPSPNPQPFYSDPVDTYYTIDYESLYNEPYSSRNDGQVIIAHNRSKMNPVYVLGGKDTNDKPEISDESTSTVQINTLYASN